ncbi:proteasome subunit alpha type-1 [Drosophila busckii]|uniref:proteasome subunit alpha type-1 n=1 Tax=Drosophila busckii TaxID=30019 RepID=UPI0014330AD5|nr:proteasome subunit alpha type-1 [Drosophila busckii]
MFRSHYDSDVTVWSPQGRLHQVEYAMEAVNLGTATVALKTEDFAVLVALCKPSSELGISLPKIISIDSHVGISIAGITADARLLSRYLRTECLSYKHSYSTIYPVQRLVTNLGNKLQITTQRYDRRPYGVGMLLAGYDEKGAHIYQVMPSANVLNCKAMAIGARSQGSRTYLERNLSEFKTSSMHDIIVHGIQAVSRACPLDEELKIAVGIVGKDQPFKLLSSVECDAYLELAKTSERHETPPETPAETVEPSAVPSDIDPTSTGFSEEI